MVLDTLPVGTTVLMNEEHWHWVGEIKTVSDTTFSVIDPKPESILLDDIATALSNICRYNGHVPTFYSVAEHSAHVADLIFERTASRELALTGLLHDAAEAYVGDMVRPLKRHPEYGAMHNKAEERIAEMIHSLYGGLFPHPEEVHQADKDIWLWEVENIRTGKTPGLCPVDARELWMFTYEEYATF